MVRPADGPMSQLPDTLEATVLTSLSGSVDRRTLLTRAALGLSGAALAGLAATASAAPSAARPAAQEGSSLTFALNGDPTLNVFVWPNQLPSVLVAKNVFSCLLKYSADDGSTVVPDLATEWSVSEDGLVWTFVLREGVTWHDGQPFTADDVKFTLDGILNPDVRAQFRAALAGVTEVAVVDPKTVTITSSVPLGSLPILLAYNIAIAPKHILEGQDLNELADFVQNPVGTGPYKVQEIVSGDRVVLTANADYYDGAPAIGSMTYKIVPDIISVVAQLLTGELDMATVEPSNLEALLGEGNLTISSALEPNTFAVYLNNSRWPFDNVLVRKAVTMAIDRPAIVEQLLLGEAVVATSSHSPAYGDFYNPNIQPYPFDTAQAEALMTEAGFAKQDGIWAQDGKPISIELMVDKGNTTREQLALVVQQYLQDFGIEVNVTVEEWSVYIERGGQLPGDYDARTGWRITAPDPDKTSEYGTDGAVNHYAYSNPVADDLLARGRAEVDPAARVAIYHELQQVLYDDCPICWMYYPNGIIAHNAALQGVPKIGIRDALLYVYKMSEG
jgi:peptide/nickel transport system substrate-binding protein